MTLPDGDAFARIADGRRLVALIGPGGVGKTTTSVLVSLAAAKAGRRVALISVDPARRLADALRLPLTGELTPIMADRLRAAGSTGSLSAAMIDQKRTFDRMVDRFVSDAGIRASILYNPFYQAAAEALSGPLEYLALAKLSEIIADSKYDLIVLDTPPATNALDFLSKPQILSDFVSKKFIQLMVKPVSLLAKMRLPDLSKFAVGRIGAMVQQLSAYAGVNSLKKLFDFLVLSESVILGINQLCKRVHETMRSADTRFVLVTSPRREACSEVEYLFRKGLRPFGARDLAVVFNRCLPAAVRAEVTAADFPAACLLGERLRERIEEEDGARQWLRAALVESAAAHPAELSVEEQNRDLADADALWDFLSGRG